MVYINRVELDVALEQRLHLRQFLALPAQFQRMVGDEPLVGEHVGEVGEHYVDADRVDRGRELFRHVDVSEVGHRRLLRERRDHRHVVAARGQRLQQALVNHPVAAAVDGKHAENVGTVGGRQRARKGHQQQPREIHLDNKRIHKLVRGVIADRANAICLNRVDEILFLDKRATPR